MSLTSMTQRLIYDGAHPMVFERKVTIRVEPMQFKVGMFWSDAKVTEGFGPALVYHVEWNSSLGSDDRPSTSFWRIHMRIDSRGARSALHFLEQMELNGWKLLAHCRCPVCTQEYERWRSEAPG